MDVGVEMFFPCKCATIHMWYTRVTLFAQNWLQEPDYMYFIDIIVQSNANAYMALMFKLISPIQNKDLKH